MILPRDVLLERVKPPALQPWSTHIVQTVPALACGQQKQTVLAFGLFETIITFDHEAEMMLIHTLFYE